ncbi:OLC1v1002540C1 [Oldenlandia corymbosa var. corymbosa]|uniref:OLC1v1002540C1 n=1 Tax=Oldenlandia corymbosa var. corymbosa TaxID=529605 RepID=A0AAV1D8H5_OLDCO|nr:OLC1v1002540C1 [Oldenlandia corymbosa var. corymbosa]
MNVRSLKQIHAFNLRNGTYCIKFLITKLLEAPAPDIHYARKVFDNTPHPNLFLYNKLIQAYSSQGSPLQSLSLYVQMRLKGLSPNAHSFNFLFTACSNLGDPLSAHALHADFVKFGLEFDIYASTSLVDMYGKLGLVHLARKQFEGMETKDLPTWNALIAGYAKSGNMQGALGFFSEMPSRNVISWTAMISGYSQNGKYRDALGMYLEMEKDPGVKPNVVTLASVLPACANLGALEVGQRIEAYAKANGYLKNIFVCNAILEMYSRCGRLDAAMCIFDEIGPNRNLCSWNTMIMGLAAHGKCKEALELFNRMPLESIRPDDVTFVGTLLACTHGGMVAKGREIFESMAKEFSVTPKLEHYGCMVDLLGRAGKLQEAYDLILSMPMRPDSIVWGAMLGACSFHGNVELGEKAAEALFKLEPSNPGNYVILSNIYASAGRWDGVAKMRKIMRGSQITKAAGYSFMEEDDQVHKFIVGDKSHPKSDQIYALLDDIHAKIELYTSIVDSITDNEFITVNL